MIDIDKLTAEEVMNKVGKDGKGWPELYDVLDEEAKNDGRECPSEIQLGAIYFCTRPLGHLGIHIALGDNRICYAWSDENDLGN